MIEHIWSVLCNSASVDIESGSISLFNVLEQITVLAKEDEIITLPIHFELATLCARENENIPMQGKLRFNFCDPKNICIKMAEMEVDLKQGLYFRGRMHFEGLQLNGSGKYKFEVRLQQENSDTWEQVATLPLLVTFQPINMPLP